MGGLQKPRAREVVLGRDTARAIALCAAVPPEQRGRVEAMALDMDANFVAATRDAVSQAAIVYDRLTASIYPNEALLRIRCEQSVCLAIQEDESQRR
jgi:hypothetical protein